MYESPINVYFSEVEMQFDSAVLRAVQRVGIDVDKNELVKALAYDRNQYDRGYLDGLMFHPAIVTNADRIRAMTDEELAKFLQKTRGGCRALTTESYVCDFYADDLNADCKACWLDWLKQESKNES